MTRFIAVTLSMVVAAGFALTQAVSTKGTCTPPPLETKEDSIMFGRIAAAIEDLGGGYYKEAEGRYAHIVRDIEKKNYHPCFVWMAYDGYSETLTALKKKEKALSALTKAVELAKKLGDREREKSGQHLHAAQELK